MTKFKLYRDYFSFDTTLGEMFDPEGDHFCYTLEDVVRGYGEKIFGKTAIPYGKYEMEIRTSPKYGEVVVIFTRKTKDSYFLENNGISFEMILGHGGNDHEDTHGCVLVNRTRDVKKFTAWGSMKKEFVTIVRKYMAFGKVYLEVIKK